MKNKIVLLMFVLFPVANLLPGYHSGGAVAGSFFGGALLGGLLGAGIAKGRSSDSAASDLRRKNRELRKENRELKRESRRHRKNRHNDETYDAGDSMENDTEQ